MGPKPPPAHDPAHGPTFLLLTKSSLLLFHPILIPTAVQVQINNGQFNAGGIANGPTWGMNVIRSPLDTRCHAIVGKADPIDMGAEVRRGWMGMITGNEGIWVAVERKGRVEVVRAEVGVDKRGRYCLFSFPVIFLPPLPLDKEGSLGGSSRAS